MLIKELNLREQSRSVLRESNLERLKIALSYFSYLKRQGTIEEQTFEVLVKYACSLFIENEVEEKIESVLERKLMQFFDSRLSDATKPSFSDDLVGWVE